VFEAPHLLILDESTNHLDIDSRAALVDALNAYEGAVILVSHDRHLLDACADDLWLVDKGTVTPFDGTLEDYQRLVLKAARGDAEIKAKLAAPAPAKRVSTSSLRNKLKQAEALMAKLEPEIARLDRELSSPELFASNPAGAADLARTRAKLGDALSEAEEIWLETGARLAEIEAP
jgi:ATP-binding cassette subfamily F protein 3